MKTSQFIDSLAADPKLRGISLRSRFWLALGFGALTSVVLFMASLGPRSDFVIAMHSPRFDLKFFDTLAMALPSALLCWRLLRRNARVGAVALLFAAPFLLLGGAVVAELFLVPAEMWGRKLIGANALHCLTIIPLLSIAPLFALLYAMRSGAPQNPALAGGLAGAAAAGIAATLYAANCPDDSPLFVASWYPLATMIVVATGSLCWPSAFALVGAISRGRFDDEPRVSRFDFVTAACLCGGSFVEVRTTFWAIESNPMQRLRAKVYGWRKGAEQVA